MKVRTSYDACIEFAIGNLKLMKSNCDCTAGKGSSATCKHVAATLYVLEHYVSTGKFVINSQ